MNPETVSKALDLVRSAWPHQNLTDHAEEGWRRVLADCHDPRLSRHTLDELVAYRKGRPHSGEFAELYEAKLSRSRPAVASTGNPDPLPKRDFATVSSHVQQLRSIVVTSGAKGIGRRDPRFATHQATCGGCGGTIFRTGQQGWLHMRDQDWQQAPHHASPGARHG